MASRQTHSTGGRDSSGRESCQGGEGQERDARDWIHCERVGK